MDQFVLIEQDDNNLYIKILSTRYVPPHNIHEDDQQHYTFSLDDKKYFGCLTTDCESFTQSTIYPYIVTITFQYYTYVQDDDKLTKLQVYDWIAKQVRTQVDYQVEQKINQVVDLQQLRQFEQTVNHIHEKVTILQQRVMWLYDKVKQNNGPPRRY